MFSESADLYDAIYAAFKDYPHEACRPLTPHEYAQTFTTPLAQMSA